MSPAAGRGSIPFRRGSTGPARRRYERLAPVYDRRWASYVAESVRETLRRLDLRGEETVLDVGCGTGALLQGLVARGFRGRLVGVDLSPAMAAVARGKLGDRAALAAAEAGRLPLARGVFDVALSASSLHYWPEAAEGLAEIARILKPGGRLVVTDWCDDYLACRIADFVLRILEPAHGRTYGTAALEGLLREAGFEDVRVERYRIGRLWGLMTATAARGG